MERSKGKKMMSQSRTSMIVEPFRSTVQRSPTKKIKWWENDKEKVVLMCREEGGGGGRVEEDIMKLWLFLIFNIFYL